MLGGVGIPPRSPRHSVTSCRRTRCGRIRTLVTEVPAGRIEQCTLGHLLCSGPGDGDGTLSCASQVRAGRGPKCPVCRRSLSSTSIRALSAEQSIAILPAKCCHCSSSVARGSLRTHEAACPRALVMCAAKDDGGCRWTGPREDQDTHEATCIYGKVEAPWTHTQVQVLTLHLEPYVLNPEPVT
jgi:hypothetical protein